MKFTKFVFFLVLIVIVFFALIIIGGMFNIQFLDWIFFAILGIVIYFTTKYLRTIDSLIAVFMLSIFNAFFLSKTSVGEQIQGIIYLFIYSIGQFYLILFSFKLIWFKQKIRLFRTFLFSILCSASYTLIQFLTYIFTNKEFNSEHMKEYFIHAFFIWIIISFSFSLTEIIYAQLEKIWTLPEPIGFSDKEDLDDD
ncbi:MAG: hypothetical protein K8S23_06810 [Candidatus Cloacimonetes bacterium]|nr:hypothetical protein [Candidatus Cloacimonadota bacterium]